MVGLLFAAAAVVEVAEGTGEGEESEAGVGHLSDEVVGAGRGLFWDWASAHSSQSWFT